jgi:hypothetical protein
LALAQILYMTMRCGKDYKSIYFAHILLGVDDGSDPSQYCDGYFWIGGLDHLDFWSQCGDFSEFVQV